MMKLAIASGEFAKVMKIARKIMPGKSAIPAYEYVHLFKKEEDYYLRAQNAEDVVECRVPFDLRGGNFEEVSLSIVDFSDMLSALPEQCLDLTFSDPKENGGGLVEVVYENGHYQLPYGSAKDFPVPTAMGEAATMNLPTGVVCGAMKTAMQFTASDTLRPVMNSVALDILKDRFVVVASNGHTLFQDVYLGGMADGSTRTALVTPSCIALMDMAIFTFGDDMVTMVTDGNRIRINGKDFSVQSRLVEGRYPNYNSVIPRDSVCSVVLEKKALLAALRRVLLMGDTSSRLVKLSYREGRIFLTARDVDFSTEATERIEPVRERNLKEGFAIGFKGDLITRVLQSLESDSVEFFMNDSSTAAVVREVEGKADRLALIMPMMLDD